MRTNHDTMGMLSYQAIGVSHTGQWDAGTDSDSPRGSRHMTTLPKEPNTSPKRKLAR
jgi:hypothetical protein